MKKLILLIVLVLSFVVYSQSNYSMFKKLSTPKKWWVVFHPFKAKCAFQISIDAKRVADSILRTGTLGKLRSSGRVDAFRHGYWMARLHQNIGESAARSLGKVQEKDAYILHKKHALEDGVIPDKVDSDMDLFNNEVGLSLTFKHEKISKKELINRVIEAVLEGEMRIIKRDRHKNFLTCSGEVIHKDSLKGKWINNKCLVPSNYKP